MSEKMIFCIGEGKYESNGIGYQKNLMMFNKPVSEKEYESARVLLRDKKFNLPIAKWVDIKDIDKPTTTQKQLGGYLKNISYKDAWKELWSTLSSDDKHFFTTLTNFNDDIFEQITGIKIEAGKKQELMNRADELIQKANELKKEAEKL